MKRKTKAQKEAELKSALLDRIMDIYGGAAGCAWSEDEWATAEIISRVMCAVRGIFLEGNAEDYRVGCHIIEYYDNPAKAAEFLYNHGVRA